MNPCELTLGVTALANSIAGCLSDEQLNIWAAVFTQLGDTLGTIAAQRSACSSCMGKKAPLSASVPAASGSSEASSARNG